MLKPITNSFRHVIPLDGIWDFTCQPANSCETEIHAAGFVPAHQLAVPGSWNEQIGELYHFFGFGWYQRDICLPSNRAGARIFLRIGAVNQDAAVWLDGQLLGGHMGGHLPIDLELTDYARPGMTQRLVIRVDNRLRQRTLPSGQARREEDRLGFQNTKPDVPFDFFPFGGIHRSVQLYTTPESRIARVRVTSSHLNGAGKILLEASADHVPAGARLACSIEGVADEAVLDADGAASLQITLPNVRIWDIGKPELYELTVTLLDADETPLDVYTLNTGVRNIHCDDRACYLNDRPVWLTGFGKHEDFPALGRAHNDAVLVKDFDLLEWTHANSFRTSHYPYDEAWYDYADRKGILVIGETPFVSLAERLFDDELESRACCVIREMIERDANHPSVILWSLANEPYLRSDRGTRFFKAMAEAARDADPSRPIGYVAHETADLNAAAEHFDWLGVNKYFGWYEGVGEIDDTLDAFRRCLAEFHERYHIPILLSEFGADALPGCRSQVPVIFTENYQCEIVEKQYRAAAALPFVFGCHVWNFAEFATGQQLNRAFGNHKGAFTRDRQPKMLAFKLRELFAKSREEITREPMPERQFGG